MSSDQPTEEEPILTPGEEAEQELRDAVAALGKKPEDEDNA